MPDTPKQEPMMNLISRSSFGGDAWCANCKHPDLLHAEFWPHGCLGVDADCECSGLRRMTPDEWLAWRGGSDLTDGTARVTLGDLRVPCVHNRYVWHKEWDGRDGSCPGGSPATVADLMSPEIRPLVVSALRAEGVLVVEKVEGLWEKFARNALFSIGATYTVEYQPGRHISPILDALAEAQPFPPAGR